MGINHGDIAGRNITRRSSGDLCVIDFGAAHLDHECPGLKCEELIRLKHRLDAGKRSRGEEPSSDDEQQSLVKTWKRSSVTTKTTS